MGAGAITIRDVCDSDFDRWARLYRGYREFYRLPADDEVVDRVWAWLHDEHVELWGLVAEHDGAVVGLAHHRRFHRPSTGSVGIYLDDLFTDPDARGLGAGRALLTSLGSLAAAEGCSVVRWITAGDNSTARRLYDSVAAATPWVTYDLVPTA